MIKRYILVFFLALFYALPAYSLETMPVSEIKPGMTGTGYSVFKGTTPEPFTAHIIGVVKKFNAGQDLILAELEGANLELTGIIEGMSGSPVYIDGKLIGAVARAWAWAKKPVAGITPIDDMLKTWTDLDDDKTKKAGNNQSAPGEDNSPTYVDTKDYGRIEMRWIDTPLMLGGMGDAATGYLRKSLEKFGLVPVQGGGDSEGETIPGEDDLAPGSVIGCPLITGDFEAAAIGTVTARDGNKVLAFGHPFFNTGPAEIPMSGGNITMVMPIQSISFKIGAAGKVLGSIRRDQASAIAGEIGVETGMIPVDIYVQDPDLDIKQEFHTRIAQIQDLTPDLIVSVMGQAAEKTAGKSGDVTVRYDLDGSFTNYPQPFHFEDMYYSPAGFFSSYTAKSILDLLTNGQKDIKLKQVTARMKITHDQKTAQIMGLSLDKAKIFSGDEVTANIRLMAFDKEEITKPIKFKIPKDTRPGIYRIVLEGGGSVSGRPSMANIYNLDQLFDLLKNWIPENSITLKLVYPEQSIGLEGKEMQGLPLSIFDAMMDTPPQNSNLFDRYDRAVYKTDFVITGTTATNIKIEKEF